jgi:2-haloacid dehalogenase
MTISGIKALTFDVFGTVVDYRRSIIREGEQLNQAKGIDVDWASFADAWRGLYRPSMERVRRGELPWTNLDALHRLALDKLLEQFKITALSEEEKTQLNLIWHRLLPWPDSVAGLTRLREKYIVATLSNGNVALLVNMAKYSGLPWDCIFSAELARVYKPAPGTYQMAVDLLGMRAEQVMMVAAHRDDLRAAQAVGMRAGFVLRPLEFGPQRIPDLTPDPTFDVVASDLVDLADQLERDN